MTEELWPEVFTADYVGTPGKRTFFLQSRSAAAARSYLMEKGQVELLAEKLRELLLMVDNEDTILSAEPARDPALALEPPGEPDWRVGTIGLSYDEEGGQAIVFLHPATAEETEPEPQEPEVRLFLRKDQVRSFVLHALAVVEEGRPLCHLCGLPKDPEGHHCPASNGHRSGG